MSDITVPSWRARPVQAGPNWRMLAVAGGLLGTVAIGGAITWGVSRMGPRAVPTIEPDARPVKIRPEAPGGLVVPNQDQLVLEPPSVRRAAERSSTAMARLDRGPESPALDLLRQQAAPPAPVAPEPAPPPVAVPSPAPVALAPPVAAPPAAPPRSAAPAPAVQAAAPVPVPAAPRPVTPTPVAAPAHNAVSPVANGRAMVQLAALSSEESARGEWERLQQRIPELAALQPVITRFEREGKPPLYRLRAGGLSSAAAARTLCAAVQAKAAPCTPIGG
ncbi:SPOR domain-containing protein [Belnapia rosea]|uniref:SPOR domain-containing protein n=1 Tax=Belnapia rosea TaxID=938405 RepID=UPI00087F054D|nr:SPOR domain-containing protein [Belnapia rosea]SDB70526.1 Sporulation related domain-containing protein [Belnapia rosea]